MSIAGSVGDVVTGLLKRDSVLSRTSVRLMHIIPPLDHGKAESELGWTPQPIEPSIRKATEFHLARRRRRTQQIE
jgi:dihydroflavonol-4-reductase